jgi:hypothetical protein
MSEAIGGRSGSAGSWAVLDRGEWQTEDELLVQLTDALAQLGPEAGEGTVLYDHIAVDAVLGALEPESESRGVSEIRFEYGRYDIKITRGGVIAASPDPEAPRLSD